MVARVPLLLDVDGVLNVSAATPGEARQRGLVEHRAVAETGTAYRLLIDPAVGKLLLSLTDIFELVWCTTWENANEAISPLLGLPLDLRRVPIPGSWGHVALHEGWSAKVPYIRRWAHEHGIARLAWVDDDTDPRDSRVLVTDFSRQHHHVLAHDPPLLDALALGVRPERGLQEQHIKQLREWAE